VGLMVGSTVGSNWLWWAIDLSKGFDSSDKRLNKIVVLQTRFTGFVKQTCRFTGSETAISREGVWATMIVTQPSYREVGVCFKRVRDIEVAKRSVKSYVTILSG
jgi:hypothetical protein